MYDDWEDYRDGMREAPWYMKYGNKSLLKKNFKRLIPHWKKSSDTIDSIFKSMKKWERKRMYRKRARMKRRRNF